MPGVGGTAERQVDRVRQPSPKRLENGVGENKTIRVL